MRYAFKVQYIGKNYAGSQIQFKNGEQIESPTVQGELEKALSTLICGRDAVNNKRPIKTVFSGRTDRGVNSLGQVVHFDTDKTIVASEFMYHLNEILPKDISVTDLKVVDERFHAQKSAKRRHYRFEFVNRKYKNAFDADLMRVKYDIDIERLMKKLKVFGARAISGA